MDRRKENGGHSTVALPNKIDKRKNKYRLALKEAADVDDVIKVIQKVYAKAMSGDMKAAQLFLEYYLGKPNQSIDLTSNGESVTIPVITFKKDD